jgi:hypothetical protein
MEKSVVAVSCMVQWTVTRTANKGNRFLTILKLLAILKLVQY